MEYIAAAVFGLAFGSFGNVLILRLSKGENVAFPASHCPKCKRALRWFHNIPLLSYIFLRGRCAFCGEKISVIYPIIEAATALLFCAAVYKTGGGYFAVSAAVTLFLLLCLAMIDIRTMTAPDSLNFLAFFAALFHNEFILENLQNALIIAGALSLLRMSLSSLLKKEAMGEADVILGSTMGAFLGLSGAFAAMFIAAVLAIIPALINRKNDQSQTPFIPFLAAGTLKGWCVVSFVNTSRSITRLNAQNRERSDISFFKRFGFVVFSIISPSLFKRLFIAFAVSAAAAKAQTAKAKTAKMKTPEQAWISEFAPHTTA